MTYKENLYLLNEFHLSMFKYNNLPETLLPNYLEWFLQKNGMVAVFRIPEGWESDGFPVGSLICTSCSLGRDLTPYGFGSEVIAVTRNGHEIRKSMYSDDMVLGINNALAEPCKDILPDAKMLEEIDVSIRFLVFWTRLAPLIRCSDEKEKTQIETAFKNMKEGIPVTIVTKKLFADLGLDVDGFSLDDLTRPELADKIQHTARLREDILRWHYTRYGQVVQGDTKLAQQSVDEVNGTVSSSLILPLTMLDYRRLMVAEINRKFNTNITVELSGAWRGEVTKYENDTGEENVDDTNDNSPDDQDTTTPDTEDQEDQKEGDNDVSRKET